MLKNSLIDLLNSVKIKTVLYTMLLLLSFIILATQVYTISNYFALINEHKINAAKVDNDSELWLNEASNKSVPEKIKQKLKELNILGILSVIASLIIILYIASVIFKIGIFYKIQEFSEILSKIMQGKINGKLPKARNYELTDLWNQLEDIAELEEDRKRLSFELVFALKEVEESNKIKSEFLTNMSHELKTPLNAIIGFSELISCDFMAGNIDDKYKEYANDIHCSGIHLLNIINNMLELSRIRTGKVILSINDVIVSDIVEEIILHRDQFFQEKSIFIENNISEDLPLLYADAAMVQQILVNIMSNVVKFTPAGGCILIDAEIEKDGRFCLSVCDNGIGIAQEQIANVVSPFHQTSESYISDQEGVGLGLALVKSIMELHGGHIKMESKLGVGTTVFLMFPDSCLISNNNFMRANQTN